MFLMYVFASILVLFKLLESDCEMYQFLWVFKN